MRRLTIMEVLEKEIKDAIYWGAMSVKNEPNMVESEIEELAIDYWEKYFLEKGE